MRLDPLFDINMHYLSGAVWLRTFGEREGAGFGLGEGTFEGPRLKGTMTWANHPRLREDDVWCPDLHGFLVTHDGAKILFTMQGLSIREAVVGDNRAVTCWITFRAPAEDARYRWLNFVVGIVEGEIDHATDNVRMKAYACVNEVATGPPAIG